MKFKAKIAQGKLKITDISGFLKRNEGRELDVELKARARTTPQNNAMHLWFTQLADALNEKHIDMRTLIREEIEISWTPYSVKEYLWRKLQIVLLGKKSTTKLKTNEIDIIYDHINRIITERTKGQVEIPIFPNQQALDEQELSNKL